MGFKRKTPINECGEEKRVNLTRWAPSVPPLGPIHGGWGRYGGATGVLHACTRTETEDALHLKVVYRIKYTSGQGGQGDRS